jgi:hypothetical protein
LVGPWQPSRAPADGWVTWRPASFAVLEDTHPIGAPIDPELMSRRVAAPTQVTMDQFAGVMRKGMRHAVSPGPSMLTNDHVRALIPVETEADLVRAAPMLDWVNKALRAELDDEAVVPL